MCFPPRVSPGVVSVFLHGVDALCPGRGAALRPRAEPPPCRRVALPTQVSDPPRNRICPWRDVGLGRPPRPGGQARGPAAQPKLPPSLCTVTRGSPGQLSDAGPPAGHALPPPGQAALTPGPGQGCGPSGLPSRQKQVDENAGALGVAVPAQGPARSQLRAPEQSPCPLWVVSSSIKPGLTSVTQVSFLRLRRTLEWSQDPCNAGC